MSASVVHLGPKEHAVYQCLKDYRGEQCRGWMKDAAKMAGLPSRYIGQQVKVLRDKGAITKEGWGKVSFPDVTVIPLKHSYERKRRASPSDLRRGLAGLSPEKRQVLMIMRENPGISQAEIARRVGVSRQAVNEHVRALLMADMVAVTPVMPEIGPQHEEILDAMDSCASRGFHAKVWDLIEMTGFSRDEATEILEDLVILGPVSRSRHLASDDEFIYWREPFDLTGREVPGKEQTQ